MLPVSNDREDGCKSYGQEPPVDQSSSVAQWLEHLPIVSFPPSMKGGGEEIMKMALKGGNEIFK